MKGTFFHTQVRFFMTKVPKIQCSTILRIVFFCKNKVLVTKKTVVKNDNRNLLLITPAYRS